MKKLRHCHPIYSVAAQETAKHRKVWLASGERRRSTNEAKTRNPVKICWGAPNSSIDLSRWYAEDRHIVSTCGGDIAV